MQIYNSYGKDATGNRETMALRDNGPWRAWGTLLAIREGGEIMTTRAIAFWVGMFSLVMGLLTYDSEVATAPVPVITGGLVVILAVFNLIPTLNECEICKKKIHKSRTRCRSCEAQQKKNEEEKQP
jgi:hypothetical protein